MPAYSYLRIVAVVAFRHCRPFHCPLAIACPEGSSAHRWAAVVQRRQCVPPTDAGTVPIGMAIVSGIADKKCCQFGPFVEPRVVIGLALDCFYQLVVGAVRPVEARLQEAVQSVPADRPFAAHFVAREGQAALPAAALCIGSSGVVAALPRVNLEGKMCKYLGNERR